jgi:hypothetical protein
VLAPARGGAVTVMVVACVALTSCTSAGSGPKGDTTRSALPAGPATAAPAGGGASIAATAIDPCALLTSADAQAVLHKPPGTGRKISTGDLNECFYDDAGPLVVAVLRGSFTRDSFQRMIERQNTGPFAETTGRAVPVGGLGDAAYSFEKAGIVEVIKNATALSITSATTATSKQVARAVLPRIP